MTLSTVSGPTPRRSEFLRDSLHEDIFSGFLNPHCVRGLLLEPGVVANAFTSPPLPRYIEVLGECVNRIARRALLEAMSKSVARNALFAKYTVHKFPELIVVLVERSYRTYFLITSLGTVVIKGAETAEHPRPV